MVGQVKKFFRRRRVSDIRKLEMSVVSTKKGIVKRIEELPPGSALELRVQIKPGEFFVGDRTGAQASRISKKYGEFIDIDTPNNYQQARREKRTPSKIVEKSLAQIEGTPETDMRAIGYSFTPIKGNPEITSDMRPRVVRFSSLLEGGELHANSELNLDNPLFRRRGREAVGVLLKKLYSNAKRARVQGAKAVLYVPSRTIGQPRYQIELDHVPFLDNPHANSIIWALSAKYEGGRRALRDSPGNMKFGSESDTESPDTIEFYDHFIAGFWGVANILSELEIDKNNVPKKMNPFVLPSREVVDFYRKMVNQVLIYDDSLSQKTDKKKHRRLHEDEIDLLLGAFISQRGVQRFTRNPGRDGSLRDYNWEIPQAA